MGFFVGDGEWRECVGELDDAERETSGRWGVLGRWSLLVLKGSSTAGNLGSGGLAQLFLACAAAAGGSWLPALLTARMTQVLRLLAKQVAATG